MTYSVSIIVGSLRRGSFARKIAREVAGYFGEGIEASIVEIGQLPLYNFDYDDPSVPDVHLPVEYTEFRSSIHESSGVLFVTPENNRTIPACLKNAIDVGSKPNDDVAWRGVPVGILSHSVGRMGGYSSQKNLRLALSYFDMPTVGQPEVFLGCSPELFDEQGRLDAESTREFLQDYIDRFSELVRSQAAAGRR